MKPSQKLLGEYPSNIQYRREIKELQTTATFGTAHTPRKMLVQKHSTY
jgi:hypothetical protein